MENHMTLEQVEAMHRLAEAHRRHFAFPPTELPMDQRLRELESRVAALEAAAAPLEWPKLDPIPSSTAADRLGMEPFELTERS